MEPCTAEHLALEHLDPVDMAFDHARVPGQGETGNEGIAVSVDTRSEGMNARQVVLPGGVEPVRQALAPAVGEHDREGAVVPGGASSSGQWVRTY
ncbi:hypothetical protein AB0E67_31675 [Streptomyces sp. NPDC032161]|uniref:hypothetical protein n=1 Tax=unclassified Streptomyces TaxID=2593676 RepID=UPI0033CFC0B0